MHGMRFKIRRVSWYLFGLHLCLANVQLSWMGKTINGTCIQLLQPFHAPNTECICLTMPSVCLRLTWKLRCISTIFASATRT